MDLSRHQKEAHRKRKKGKRNLVSCSMRAEKFNCSEEKEDHEEKIHGISRNFICSICKSSFQNYTGLLMHFSAQHHGLEWGGLEVLVDSGGNEIQQTIENSYIYEALEESDEFDNSSSYQTNSNTACYARSSTSQEETRENTPVRIIYVTTNEECDTPKKNLFISKPTHPSYVDYISLDNKLADRVAAHLRSEETLGNSESEYYVKYDKQGQHIVRKSQPRPLPMPKDDEEEEMIVEYLEEEPT